MATIGAGDSFGAQLRRLRVAGRLTQEALAYRSGLSVDAISALEGGRRRRPHTDTVRMLADALDLDAGQRESLAAAAVVSGRPRAPQAAVDRTRSVDLIREGRAPMDAAGETLAPATRLGEAHALLASMPTAVLPEREPLPAGSRMPLAPNPLFVGRGSELLELAQALRGRGTTVALGQVVASTGLGGLGKTQLAVEFVHRFGRYFSGGVFWLSFASLDEIPLQVAACAAADAMGLAHGVAGLPLEERVQRARRAWQSAVPRLLVFDNCEDESLLDAWRPTTGGCRVLVTSRRSHWSPTLGVAALPLCLLPRPDSIELLRRYRPDVADGDRRLDAIAGELGDLPLALHLAGRYLLAYRAEVTLDDYLAELGRPSVIRHASLLGEGLDDSPSPTHHVQSLAQTFALCLGRLDREREVDRVAIAVLARMACLAPGEGVPRELLGRTLEEADPRQLADGLRRLGAVGLVEEAEGCPRLHRLLVHFVRQECPDREAQNAVDRVLVSCGDAADDGLLTGQALAATIPHLVHAATGGDGRRLAALYRSAGLALQAADDLRSARRWLERALAVRVETLGEAHRDTLASVNDLGRQLAEQAELAAARRLHERALAGRERVLGPTHPDTAQSACNLANVLWLQGELGEARPLLERALAIMEMTSGPDHPGTASVLNHLALLLRDQGELAAARAVHERALAVHARAQGADHPNTARSLHNLALVVRAQGDAATARRLHERALAIRERVLGPDQLDTAYSLHNLGVLLRDEGELSLARQHIERALDIRERTLGPHHADTARSLHSLAVLVQRLGDLPAARGLLERALETRERTLGHDHPHTAASVNQMALLQWQLGETTVARSLLERALAVRERVLGPDHVDTVATGRALAELAAAEA